EAAALGVWRRRGPMRAWDGRREDGQEVDQQPDIVRQPVPDEGRNTWRLGTPSGVAEPRRRQSHSEAADGEPLEGDADAVPFRRGAHRADAQRLRRGQVRQAEQRVPLAVDIAHYYVFVWSQFPPYNMRLRAW